MIWNVNVKNVGGKKRNSRRGIALMINILYCNRKRMSSKVFGAQGLNATV